MLPNLVTVRFTRPSGVISSESKLFQAILENVSELFGVISNQSEKRFASRLMKNGKKSIRLNSIYSGASILMNMNQAFNLNKSKLYLE